MPAVPTLDAAARRSLALLLAGALLPLAGCTATDDAPSADGGGTGSSRDVPHLERDQIASGGTLRWAVNEVPRTLNAFQPDADAGTDRVAGATLPALFTLDSAARPQLNPDYLESADITRREPRQTVVYKLNPKAEWSSGRSIGVSDFKAQWKALSGRHRSYEAARNAGYDRIKKVTRGAGAHEVKVVFRKPLADWKALFTPLYPKSVMGRAGDFNHGARTSLPSSAGPFRVKGIHEGDESVRLVRNKRWWGDRAKLKRITLRAVPGDQRKAALRRGKLDLAEVDVSAVRRIVAAREGGGPGGEDAKGNKGNAKSDTGRAARKPAKKADRSLRHFAVRQAFDPA
ncbi:MAG: ABC transporter substrate-binding protein, partial [Streptomyces sp.]